MIHFIEAPAIAHGRVRGYDHRVPNRILPGEFYAEAAYACDAGFGFEAAANAPRAMYCSEGEWVGRRPKCVKEESVEAEGPCNAVDAAQCEQACTLDRDVRFYSGT